MAQKIYNTTTATGLRYYFEINEAINSAVGHKGGTFRGGQADNGRIACFQLSGGVTYAARAYVMEYIFTTPSNVAKITVNRIDWVGNFNAIEGNTAKSKPRCLITSTRLPGNYLDIWNQGEVVTFNAHTSAATAYSQSNTLVYSADLSTKSNVLQPGQTYYIYVFDSFTWPAGWGQRQFITTSVQITVNETNAVVYIDNGTTFEPYEIYIDNGSSWDLYQAYIDNGSSWEPCG